MHNEPDELYARNCDYCGELKMRSELTESNDHDFICDDCINNMVGGEDNGQAVNVQKQNARCQKEC